MKISPERVWWIGGLVATGIVLFGAFRVDFSHFSPDTPFDNTRSGHAEQWRFLQEASAHVPAGATFTVHAADPDTEMSLYMMAVGLLPDATAIPRTYYGKPVAGSAPARFVVAFGTEAETNPDLRYTLEIAGGTVTDRGSPQP